jgi:glycosyltransferase involved in cell wall biosynthesis
MSLITVLTPTYNRAQLLPRLYNSLLTQTSKDFGWVVVDDGSIDDTGQIVKIWINENKIPIKYLKKENGGKHTAVNFGVKNITTELTFILDSDDYIVENAIEKICFYFAKYKDTENICGITFHRQTDRKINGGAFPQKEQIENYPQFQVNIWHGDTAQIFYTEILRNFPFPEYNGKLKCVSEDIVWIPMGLKYKTIYISEILTISEYQASGLTKNLRKTQNYQAQYERGLLYLNPVFKIKYRLRGALIANVYANFLGIKPKLSFLMVLMYLPGLAVHKIWKWNYKMEDEK